LSLALFIAAAIGSGSSDDLSEACHH